MYSNVIAVSETWLDCCIPIQPISLPCYCKPHPHDRNRYGGSFCLLLRQLFIALVDLIWKMLTLTCCGWRRVLTGAEIGGDTAPKILPGPPQWPPKIFQVSFWKSYTDHWQLPLLQNWPLQWPPQMKMSGSAPESWYINFVFRVCYQQPNANARSCQYFVKATDDVLNCVKKDHDGISIVTGDFIDLALEQEWRAYLLSQATLSVTAE